MKLFVVGLLLGGCRRSVEFICICISWRLV